MGRLVTWFVLLIAVLAVGCAKYNTFYNARKAFDSAEHVREQRLKQGEDVSQPTNTQNGDYQLAIKKCQKLLEEYPGHSLTDDALFLMAKSYHRMQSYRMSIAKLDLLFQNFPANKFMEEALFLQAANHMFIGSVANSNDYLIQLQQQFPDSKFQAEALRVGGDNAFSLERWEQARDSYLRFLGSFAEDEHAPQVGYNLAYCHWMLQEYRAADDRLEALIAGEPTDRKLLFEARLLKVRCLSRIGRNEDAVVLSEEIAPEAEVYASQGLVALAQAEDLVNQGRFEEAAPLLENLPEEWLV
ncbi:tetratricopeptide repeat protein, partial [bacterium]|nr:tetratricopeptide repeat protein [bacterium]